MSNLLINAIKTQNLEVVKWLLENDADPNEQDVDGVTALMWASGSYHAIEIVNILLNYIANIDIRSSNLGNTALMCAIYNGNTEIVKILLEAGADPELKNKNGEDPLMLASDRGMYDIVNLLKEFYEKNEKKVGGGGNGSDSETRISTLDSNKRIRIAFENLVNIIAEEIIN